MIMDFVWPGPYVGKIFFFLRFPSSICLRLPQIACQNFRSELQKKMSGAQRHFLFSPFLSKTLDFYMESSFGYIYLLMSGELGNETYIDVLLELSHGRVEAESP